MKGIKEHLNSKTYTLQNMQGQSLWYSKNAILSVSLMSGFGLPWNYDNSRVHRWLDVQDNISVNNAPENPVILRAVYKKGDPKYTNAYNGNKNDYQNFLWNDSSFKKIITPMSQSYLIMNELMLAKYMARCSNEAFTNTENLYEKKATALLLLNSAALQAKFISDFMRNHSGLFISKLDKSENPYGDPVLEEIDKPPTISEQALVLEALSMLSNTLNDDGYPIFKNMDLSLEINSNAQEIYNMFLESPGDVYGSKTKELCNIISSCIEYSVTSPDDSSILDYITTLALELESRVDMSGNLVRFPDEDSLTSNSSSFMAVKTLLQAYKFTGIYKFLSSAQLLYRKLNLLWDKGNGLFLLDDADKYKYTLRDIGSVLGGLNSIRLFGEDNYSSDACEKLVTFFNTAVNSSGLLQTTAPPPGADDYEGYLNCARNNSDSIVYEDFCCPGIPHTLEKGIAPVFGKKFTYKPKKKKFTINSSSFYSDYALYTMNEMLCMNYPVIDCYHTREITVFTEAETE